MAGLNKRGVMDYTYLYVLELIYLYLYKLKSKRMLYWTVSKIKNKRYILIEFTFSDQLILPQPVLRFWVRKHKEDCITLVSDLLAANEAHKGIRPDHFLYSDADEPVC